MIRRTTRRGILDPSSELDAMRDARRALCLMMSECPAESHVYMSARTATDALDHVAALMTGDRGALVDDAF